jgi:hypothetical protein
MNGDKVLMSAKEARRLQLLDGGSGEATEFAGGGLEDGVGLVLREDSIATSCKPTAASLIRI